MVSGFTDDRQVREGNGRFSDNWELSAQRALTVTRTLIADYASRPHPSPRVAPTLSGLTDRELDVLRLVARGLANREVAAELVMAEQTVKTHVSRMLAKLQLRDRTQLVIAAYESGLVRAGD